MKNNHHQTGMTLIELMIVVAIVGILVGLGYPSYTQYVARAKRAEAVSNLMELSQWMERYYTETGSYTGATLPFTKSPKDGTSTDYTLAANIGSATTYTITATAVAGQATADTTCGDISVNNTGLKCILVDDSGTIKCSNGDAAAKTAVAGCF